MEKYAALILAAGKGTRMNEGTASPIPKVMFFLNDKPIIRHSVDLIKDAGIEKVVLVVGYRKELVEEYFGDEVIYAPQEQQLGTGHAVACAKKFLQGQAESVIIFYGDNPLYKPETIRKLVDIYEKEGPTVAMLSAFSDDPSGYGRVFRDKSGDVKAIIEHKDCNQKQLENHEWNPGFYIFNSEWLWDNIEKLENDNSQHEFYLTDMIEKACEQGKRIIAIPVSEESEALGINNPSQLSEAELIIKERSKRGSNERGKQFPESPRA